ncbi:GNAT family N-acetyltransferase [Caldiplasma sukawensis]
MERAELIVTIEKTNAMLDRKGLDEKFFEKIGIERINLDGIKGYVTPFNSENANHVGLANFSDNIDHRIDEVINFFKERKKSFSWIIGPSTKPNDIKERLVKKGFYYDELNSEYGVAMKTSEIGLKFNNDYTVDEINIEEMENYTELISSSFGMGIDNIAESLVYMSKMINSTERYKGKIKLFVATQKYSKEKVGFSIMEMDTEDGYAILDGAAVKKEFRGKGIYKNMIIKRMEIAKENGIDYVIVHALKSTSAPILEKVGFERICELNMYNYKIES